MWTTWNPDIQFSVNSAQVSCSNIQITAVTRCLSPHYSTMWPLLRMSYLNAAHGRIVHSEDRGRSNILCFLYLLLPKSQSMPLFTVHCLKQW